MADLQNPWVMTRQQVKDYLGITDATYDTQIDLYLPVVSDDIQLITNNNFIISKIGDLDSTDTISDISTSNIDYGNVVTTDSLDNVAITSIDSDAETITVETAATVTSDDTEVLINIFPKAKKTIAARMVWYQIKKNSIDSSGILQGEVESERWATYNYTLAKTDSGTIGGYPAYIVRGLAEITIPRFA
jgi:hypothetical protein